MDFFSHFGINLNNFHRSKSSGTMHTCDVRLKFTKWIKMGKNMVGVPKRTIPFYIQWTPSFKTCCNLMAHSC
jgi:hypothetical protein